MALTKFVLADVVANTAEIVYEKGSEFAFAAPCNSSGSITGAVFQLPIIKESTVDDKTAENSLSTEGGNVYKSDGTREATLSLTFMQGGGGASNAGKLMAGGYFTIVKEESREGTPWYSAYPIAKAAKEVTRKKPGNDTVLKFNLQNNSTDIGVNLATFASASFASTLTGTLTVTASEIYTSFKM